MRLQGLFESFINSYMIENQITPPDGLYSKLEVLLNQGYINQQEFDELNLWRKLRNSICHAPPEPIRSPGILSENDISTYKTLLNTLCYRWCNETYPVDYGSQH